MSDFAKINEVWERWLADAPVPARTTVETALAAEDLLIEITVCAAA